MAPGPDISCEKKYKQNIFARNSLLSRTLRVKYNCNEKLIKNLSFEVDFNNITIGRSYVAMLTEVFNDQLYMCVWLTNIP